MFAFDEDTAVVPEGAAWAGTITDRWSIGPIPNGGYVGAIALQAIRRTSAHADPLSITTHFLRPASPGPVRVAVEVVRAGRSTTTLAASMIQGPGEIARVLAAFGDLAVAGPTAVTGTPPPLPPPDELASSLSFPEMFAIAHRFDIRLDPQTAGGISGDPTGVAEVAGWFRFADGRDADVASLMLFADAMPPAVLNVVQTPWVPTLELTVHVRGRPAPGWLRARFRTRYLIDGHLEEDGEVWDSTGRLVALSRQYARVRSG